MCVRMMMSVEQSKTANAHRGLKSVRKNTPLISVVLLAVNIGFHVSWNGGQ